MQYSSVTVAGMRDLVNSMTDAYEQLTDTIGPLRVGMSSAGLPTERTSDVDKIAGWVESQLPELRRRHSLAVGLSSGSPDHVPARIAEENVWHTPDEAADHGRALARALDTSNLTPDTMAALQSKLAPHTDDPDVMAGFFSGLGADMVELLPRAIVSSEVADGRGYLRMFSRALGTALSAPYHDGDMEAVRQMFTAEPENAAQGWDRLALLQDGRFPSAWLARATRANALDEFAGSDGYRDKQRGAELHLSGSTVALALFALRRNPASARVALNNYPRSIGEYITSIYPLDKQNRYHPDVPAAFGAALQAAAEADEHPDDRSRAAERFTADLVTNSAGHGSAPATMRRSLEEIAVSYIHEFAAGSFADNGAEVADKADEADEAEEADKELWTTVPPYDFPKGTGVEPAFFVKPNAIYGFIRTFQGPDVHRTGPFSERIGTEFDALLDDAIVADQSDGGTRTPGVMRLFGGLNNLLYLARRDHAADIDSEEKNARSWVAKIVGGALSLPPLSGVTHYFWSAAQSLMNHYRSNWVNDAGDHEHGVTSEHQDTESILWHLIAERLVEHGIGADALQNAPDGLLDADGGLRPMDEIFPDADLRGDFYTWVNETDELDDAASEAEDAWDLGAKRAGGAATVVPEQP